MPKYTYSVHVDGEVEVDLTYSDDKRSPSQLARNWAEIVFEDESLGSEVNYRVIVEEIDSTTSVHLNAWAVVVEVREAVLSREVSVERIPPGNV